MPELAVVRWMKRLLDSRSVDTDIYATTAGLAFLAIVIVAVWLYDSSLSSQLPSLPSGMKFVGGPAAP